MSTENMASTPKTKKIKEEKSAKKRRHEQQTAEATTAATGEQEEQETTQSQPKRARIHSSPTKTTTTSPFIHQTSTFYLPISPIYHNSPISGLCAEHISPLLLTYYPPIGGVILSYTNPRLSSSPHDIPNSRDAPNASSLVLAKSIDEYAASFIWLTVDFLLLRPTPGAKIQGYVSVQNESYLGLICWNFFNAGIDRKRTPSTWKWVPNMSSTSSARSSKDWMKGNKSASDESSGHYVDAEGNKVEGLVEFTVKDFESAPSSERERGFLSIEGTLLDQVEDAKVDAEAKAARKPKSKRREPALSMV